MNAQTQDPGEDDVVHRNPNDDPDSEVYITDPGPARANGGGTEPDIHSRRESR